MHMSPNPTYVVTELCHVQELFSLGIHPSFAHLSANDNGGNARLARQLQRVLSALVFWQPGLTLRTALPRLALPFVRLYGSNSFACFEVTLRHSHGCAAVTGVLQQHMFVR